eukprot:9059453-Alexandrium_andersonii.AAC.1
MLSGRGQAPGRLARSAPWSQTLASLLAGRRPARVEACAEGLWNCSGHPMRRMAMALLKLWSAA